MQISLHKTRAVFELCNTVSEDDLREAAQRLGSARARSDHPQTGRESGFMITPGSGTKLPPGDTAPNLMSTDKGHCWWLGSLRPACQNLPAWCDPPRLSLPGFGSRSDGPLTSRFQSRMLAPVLMRSTEHKPTRSKEQNSYRPQRTPRISHWSIEPFHFQTSKT